MPLNANTAPYNDDYDQEKQFVKIMFRPGFPVQARELTQLQTMLQKQIERHGKHVFNHGARVLDGQIAYGKCKYLKLADNELNDPAGTEITLSRAYSNTSLLGAKIVLDSDSAGDYAIDDDGSVITPDGRSPIAQVIISSERDGADPNTLYVTYESGDEFAANDFIRNVVTTAFPHEFLATINTSPSSVGTEVGDATYAGISNGVYFVTASTGGYFAYVPKQRIVLSKYNNTPTYKVGLQITESFVTEVGDGTLYDNATGTTQSVAPGAHRLKLALDLAVAAGSDGLTIDPAPALDFVELLRIEDGNRAYGTNMGGENTIYSILGDALAKRTYDESGNYVVSEFDCRVEEATSPPGDQYRLIVQPTRGKASAKAYIQGRPYEQATPWIQYVDKARAPATVRNLAAPTRVGAYIYVTDLRSQATDGVQYLQPERMPVWDLHSVNTASVDISSAEKYISTKIGSFRVRDVRESSPNTHVIWTSDFIGSPAITGIFQDGPTKVPGEFAANDVKVLEANTSTYDNAYIGAKVTITSSENHNAYIRQTRTIIKSVAIGGVLTLDQPFDQPTANADFPGLGEGYSISMVPATAATGNGCIVNSGVNDHDVGAGDATVIGTTTDGIFVSNRTANAELVRFRSTANTNPFIGGNQAALLFPLDVGPSRVANSVDESVTDAEISFLARYEDQVVSAGAGGPATFDISGYRDTGSSFTAGRFVSSNAKDYVIINVNTGLVIPTADITVSAFSTTSVSVTSPFIGDEDLIRGIAPMLVYGVTAKTKTLHQGYNTQDVNYEIDTDRTTAGNGHIVFATPNMQPGAKDNLGVVDVYQIRDIYDTGLPTTKPTGDIIASTAHKVTENYTLDTGQREDLYDYASVILKPGATPPRGQLLVVVDWFSHTDALGSGGYFTVDSYRGQVAIDDIPTFTSERTGNRYKLREWLDFRPSREVQLTSQDDANTSYYTPIRTAPSLSAGSKSIAQVDGSGIFFYGMQYFAPRFDKVVLGTRQTSAGANTGMLQVVSGTTDQSPAIAPRVDEEDMALFTLSIPSYTFNASDISIMREANKRWTMKDITKIESRVDRLEYYSSLNLLEQELTDIKIWDNSGQLERFKNGFLIDTFDTGTAVADIGTPENPNLDFHAAIGRGVLRPAVEQENMQMSYSGGDSTGVQVTQGLLHLPYSLVTNDSYLQQIRATEGGEENINPFQVQTFHGEINLSPSSDVFKSDVDAPDRHIDTAGSRQAFVNQIESLNDRMGVTLANWGEWEDDWFGIEKTDTSYMTKDPTGAFERVTSNPPPAGLMSRIFSHRNAQNFNLETGFGWGISSELDYASNPAEADATGLRSGWDQAGTDWIMVYYPWGHNEWGSETVPTQTHVFDDEIHRTVTTQEIGQFRRGTQPVYRVNDEAITIGRFIVNSNALQYMRPVSVKFAATSMKPSTVVYPYFDGVGVTQYAERANVLVLENDLAVNEYVNPFNTNSGEEEILIAAGSSGRGIAIGAEGNTAFLVSANGRFDVGDTVTGSKTTPALTKTVVSYKHNSGQVMGAGAATITLDDAAANSLSWWTTSSGTRAKDVDGGSPGIDPFGRTVYITEGRGYGQSRTIQSYSNTTNILVVDPVWSLTPNTSSRYSIGEHKTSHRGSVYGVFHLPNYNWANRVLEEYQEAAPAVANVWQSTLATADERTLDTQRFLSGTKIFSLRDTTNIFDSDIKTHAEEPFISSGLIQTRERIILDAYGISLETQNIQDSRVITDRTVEDRATGAQVEIGTISWFDPLAQSFLVDPHKYPEGIFIDSVDLWFKTKHDNTGGTDIPVTVELRPNEAGVPSASQIISQVSVSSEDIKLASGGLADLPSVANTATITNFKFKRPVHLMGGAEYSVVVRSDSIDYEIWTAKIGDNQIGTGGETGIPAQIVDSQPHLGLMFKSQNGSTWQPEVNQDMMFRLRKCEFDVSSSGTAIWKSANAISEATGSFARVGDQLNHTKWTTSSDGVLGNSWTNPYSYRLWHNDFLFDRFRIDTTQLDFPSSSVGFEYDAVKETESTVPSVVAVDPTEGYKPFTINSDVIPDDRLQILKNKSGSFIVRGTITTNNKDITPVINLERLSLTMIKNLIDDGGLHSNTWPRSSIMTDDYSTGNIVGGGFYISDGGTGYDNDDVITVTTASGKVGIGATGKVVANGTGSVVGITLSNVGNTYLHSPTIDLSGAGGGDAVVGYIGEDVGRGPGNFQARYMTKKIILASGFDSRDIRVFLTAAQPANTQIHVYAKVRSQHDAGSFDNKPWQLLARGQARTAEISRGEDDFREISFGGGGEDDEYPLAYLVNPDGVAGGGERYLTFHEFAIKIVMQSTTARVVPVVRDLRAIAVE